MSVNNDYDVLILGAGIAGLSAAQELAEKKLRVCVLEAAPYIGGKLISVLGYPLKPPPSATSAELQSYLASQPVEDRTVANKVPIEHGFRVYPENYNNLLNIMKKILTTEGLPVSSQFTNELTLAQFVEPVQKNSSWVHIFLSKLERIFFGLALYTPYIVCDQRALKYDDISIEKQFRIKKRSSELAGLILRLTNTAASCTLTKTSTLAVVNLLMNYYYSPGRTGFRTFDRPTHIAFLDHWHKYLKNLNVNIHLNARVIGLNLATENNQVKITEVITLENSEKKIYKAKYIISALPVDCFIHLINQNYEMLRQDSRLVDLYKIMTLPATGVQLYYETPIKDVEKKLFILSMATHPWGISYAEQTSYWKNSKDYAGKYGVITIYVAVTNQKGRYINKTFQQCNANEIAFEMFSEIEDEFKKRGIVIPKRIGYYAHSYQNETTHLPEKAENPVFGYHYDGTCKQDLLHLCVVGMKKWRPLPETLYLGNLFLCGSYTNNNTYYVSTMESACESGRRAANSILQAFDLPPLTIYNVQVPRHIRILRSLDKFIYTFRIPNPLEVVVALLGHTLNTSHIHMDPKIRSYENMHW